jgi:adenosine kinase
MQYSHLNPVANIVEKRPDIMLVVVSPDGRDGMLQHIQHAHDSQIAVMFDPGQAMPLFSGEELLQMVKQSNYLIMNDYEAQLMMDKTQCTREELAQQVDVLIITQGALGSEVWSRTTPESSEMTCQPIHIPSVKPIQIVDPTGCGDAYRAGFIYGLLRGWSAIHAAQLGSVMGALKIEAAGGQNHQPALATIQAQFTTHFNHNPWLASLQDELRHTL